MTILFSALNQALTLAKLTDVLGQLATIFPIIVVVILVILLLSSNIRIVPQAHNYIIERLGAYRSTWGTGIHFKIPFIERVAKRISLKERVADFEPQAVITKDNVTMQIDTVVFYQVIDPKLYTYGIENPIFAIENLSATTLRNIIGDLELDETLTSRDIINARMRQTLDEATDPWGIKVNRVELKNIIPPAEIQNAMERQMKAEREKRERILKAEGHKQSAITIAEGEKEAAILEAEAKKQCQIREAEGKAEAIYTVQEATARGLSALKAVNADNILVALKGMEALEKLANGRSTKIIVPSDLQGLASVALSLKEVISKAEIKNDESGDAAAETVNEARERDGYKFGDASRNMQR